MPVPNVCAHDIILVYRYPFAKDAVSSKSQLTYLFKRN